MVDKNQAIIDFLLTCPQIVANPLYFNFLKAKDNDKQIVTQSNEKSLNSSYVDGSVTKRYTFSIIDYRSVVYEPLPKMEGYTSENVEELLDVQGILDWVDEQNEARNYPNFGTGCDIDSMRCTSENPNLNGVDTNITPALAKYSITIQIDYLDTTKAVWNN